DRHASALCLVAQKHPQLPKTPVVLLHPLLSANRHPVAYPGQIFQRQRGLRVFGILDEAFGQAVIGPPLKAGLLPGHLLQATFGTFGARGLVGLTSGVVSLPDGLNRLSSVGVAIRVRRQVGNSQVYTEKARGLNRRVFWYLNGGIQEKRAIPVD